MKANKFIDKIETWEQAERLIKSGQITSIIGSEKCSFPFHRAKERLERAEQMMEELATSWAFETGGTGTQTQNEVLLEVINSNESVGR